MGLDEQIHALLEALNAAAQSGHVTKSGFVVLTALLYANVATLARSWTRLDTETIARATQLSGDTVRRQITALRKAGAIELRPGNAGHHREVRLMKIERKTS